MTPPCVEPLALYHPRDPRAWDLWRLMDQHFETFQQVYDERFQAKYGYWRPVVERSVAAFLKCGDLHEGFARVRCPDCHHQMFVAFSCREHAHLAAQRFQCGPVGVPAGGRPVGDRAIGAVYNPVPAGACLGWSR